MTPSAGSRTLAGDALSELVVHVFRLNGLLVSSGDALAQPAGQTSARWRVWPRSNTGPRPSPRSRGAGPRPAERAAGGGRPGGRTVLPVRGEPGAPSSATPADHAPGPARAAHDPGGTAGVGGRPGCGIGEADLRAANAVLAERSEPSPTNGPTASCGRGPDDAEMWTNSSGSGREGTETERATGWSDPTINRPRGRRLEPKSTEGANRREVGTVSESTGLHGGDVAGRRLWPAVR